MNIENFKELFPIQGSHLVLKGESLRLKHNEVEVFHKQDHYENGVSEEQENKLFVQHLSGDRNCLLGFNGFAANDDSRVRSFSFDIDFKILKHVTNEVVIKKIKLIRSDLIQNYCNTNFGRDYGVPVISRNGGIHFYIHFSTRGTKFPLASEIIEFANLLPPALGFTTESEQINILNKVKYEDLSDEDKACLNNGDTTILDKVVMADFDTTHVLPTREINGKKKGEYAGSIYLPYKNAANNNPMGFGINPATQQKMNLDEFCEVVKSRVITGLKIKKHYMPMLRKLPHRCTQRALLSGVTESTRHNSVFSVLRCFAKATKGDLKKEKLEELVSAIIKNGSYDASTEIEEVLEIPKEELKSPHLLGSHPFCDKVCKSGAAPIKKHAPTDENTAYSVADKGMIDVIIYGGKWKVVDAAVESAWGTHYRLEYYKAGKFEGLDIIPNDDQKPEKVVKAAARATKGQVFFQLPGGKQRNEIFQELLHFRLEEAGFGDKQLSIEDYTKFNETRERAEKLLRFLRILEKNASHKINKNYPYLSQENHQIRFTEEALEDFYLSGGVPLRVQADIDFIIKRNRTFDWFGEVGEQEKQEVFYIDLEWFDIQQNLEPRKRIYKKNLEEANKETEKIISLVDYKKENA